MNDLEPLPSLAVSQDEVDTLQLARLRTSLRSAAQGHPFYRPYLDGLDFESWDSLRDLDAIPITEKSDISADPEAFRLQDARGEAHELWDVIYTSGTTSKPIPIYQSPHDFRRILFAQSRMSEIRGTKSSDVIANLFPLAVRPNGSWLRVNDHAVAIGAKLVAGLGGPNTSPYSATRRLSDVARVVSQANPTILWGVGSYIRRFVAACHAAGHSLASVRMVIASGEAMTPSVSSGILDGLRDLGAMSPVISPGFGASELQCSLVPCSEGSGLHNPAPELFLLQTVDEAGHTLPDGEVGRLAITHLDRTGTVLIRYALGDTVTLERGRCPLCGRAGERMVAHHGRGDTLQKVRGQLVDLTLVDSLIAADRDVAEHAIDVVPAGAATPGGMDILRIRIAVGIGVDFAVVSERITNRVTKAVSVKPVVEQATAEALYPVDSVMKPERLSINP